MLRTRRTDTPNKASAWPKLGRGQIAVSGPLAAGALPLTPNPQSAGIDADFPVAPGR